MIHLQIRGTFGEVYTCSRKTFFWKWNDTKTSFAKVYCVDLFYKMFLSQKHTSKLKNPCKLKRKIVCWDKCNASQARIAESPAGSPGNLFKPLGNLSGMSVYRSRKVSIRGTSKPCWDSLCVLELVKTNHHLKMGRVFRIYCHCPWLHLIAKILHK